MTQHDDIRDVIERWFAAIREGNLDGVVHDRAADVVMYDVPPPFDGVTGIDAYRDTWPPFFDFIRSGAVFELVDLTVVSGTDIAFAHGLARCGTPKELEANPANRLRLTFGLRKVDGRWLVSHEHHSFPMLD